MKRNYSGVNHFFTAKIFTTFCVTSLGHIQITTTVSASTILRTQKVPDASGHAYSILHPRCNGLAVATPCCPLRNLLQKRCLDLSLPCEGNTNPAIFRCRHGSHSIRMAPSSPLQVEQNVSLNRRGIRRRAGVEAD